MRGREEMIEKEKERKNQKKTKKGRLGWREGSWGRGCWAGGGGGLPNRKSSLLIVCEVLNKKDL